MLDSVGDWINDRRDSLRDDINVAEWVDDAEEWLGDTFESVFEQISEIVTWATGTLENGLLAADPPLLAVLFAAMAIRLGARAAGAPVLPAHGAIFGGVALVSVVLSGTWLGGALGAVVALAMIVVGLGASAAMSRDTSTTAAPLALGGLALVPVLLWLSDWVLGYLLDSSSAADAADSVVAAAVILGAVAALPLLREGVPPDAALLAVLAAITLGWGEPEIMGWAFAALLALLLAGGAVRTGGFRYQALQAAAFGGVAIAAVYLEDPLFTALAFGVIAWELRSLVFGLFTVVSFGLIDVMELWPDAMETLSLVLVASSIAVGIGIPVGIAATRSRVVSFVVKPVLDFMQTMPAMVYLIPAVGFFRIGTVPGAVATVVFAMPPAVRLTELGIRQVDREVVEAGEAFGTPPSRILTRIQIPLAMPTIMAGVNQVIMLALSMVVLAGMVGGGGLGTIVFRSLSRIETGIGFQAGLGVVILAIFLDRVTAAMGQNGARERSRHREVPTLGPVGGDGGFDDEPYQPSTVLVGAGASGSD